MTATAITHVAAVAIIYRASAPNQLFMEVKDDGYPNPFVRRKLNFIGGNWIGEAATQDDSPLETLIREIGEELSLDRGYRTAVELELLGQANAEVFKPTPISDELVTDGDHETLNFVTDTICRDLEDWGSYLHFSHPQVGGGVALVSYWSAGLDEETWEALVELQTKFGNLSNEAPTVIISADEIFNKKLGVAFVHAPALQGFLLGQGFNRAYDLPIMSGIHIVPVGLTPTSYEWILDHYEVAKKPV